MKMRYIYIIYTSHPRTFKEKKKKNGVKKEKVQGSHYAKDVHLVGF
jgi:hypothetical protein